MISHKIRSKFLIISVFILLCLNTTSLGSNQEKIQSSSLQDPVPHVFGQMGENQWFISAVTISFDYDPAKVMEIHYNLSGTWYTYFAPFNVVNDGIYFMHWIWIETSGRPHNGLPIEFRIDKTAPMIELNKKTSGKNKMLFTADANDETSKIERVEFYLNDVLTLTVYGTPYQYNWTGEEQQTVYAIAYDYAGHFIKSDNSTTPRSLLRNHYVMQRFFILIQALLRIYL